MKLVTVDTEMFWHFAQKSDLQDKCAPLYA